VKEIMNPDLCIGIASTYDSLEVAALEPGKAAVVMKFPATGMGVEGIRHFLSGYTNPVRMAVAGVAALSLALSLGNVCGRETFVVSSSIAEHAVDLARYAEHAA